MLFHYINEKYIDSIIEEIDKIKSKDYYVQMGIAWAISICYIRFPEKTMKYLKNNSLDTFTHNKAIQKCIESYRVKEEDKNMLRTMRRK